MSSGDEDNIDDVINDNGEDLINDELIEDEDATPGSHIEGSMDDSSDSNKGASKNFEPKQKSKKHRRKKNEFIDDEAELSGDDEVSDDEADGSDLEALDLDLVDQNARELDSDEEEEVRHLYHKQLENEDRRAVLLLQEQLEDNKVDIGHGRRKKFKWQTKERMENYMPLHSNLDGFDEDEDDDDDDSDYDLNEVQPRLRRPTTQPLVIGSSRTIRLTSASGSFTPTDGNTMDGSSNHPPVKATTSTRLAVTSDLNKYLYRDRELVQALSTKETTVQLTREDKDRVIQRELKKVQATSVFDQLFS